MDEPFILTLEPIPSCNYGISLANLLPKDTWNTLRRTVYQNARYTCEICGAMDVEVHCHEVWHYTDKKPFVQKLVELKCICKDCHAVKHWWHTVAEIHAGKLPQFYLEQLIEHFCLTNRCSRDEFDLYKVVMGTLADIRNKRQYRLDWGVFLPEKVIKICNNQSHRKDMRR